MVEIKLENLRKTFGEIVATDMVNMTIEEGELTTLLGPSGCGKTTLLRLIAGFYVPDSGRVFFDDREVTLEPPHKRNTGMCFQNYALWPHLTVFDNVAYGLKIKRVQGRKYTKSAIAKRVDAALELVRLGGLGGRHIHQLSGGQQQRVALARALVIEPDVLLLDEPLSNLDAKLRVEMREEIIRIQKEMSITTIYVTHDQVEALSISDRVAVMDIGYVQQFDTPRKIYADPQTIFVADFIGRCTFVQGKVEKIGEFIEVQLPDGQSLSGFSTIDNYPFEVGEDVKCAIRPENLMLKSTGSKDNELAGTVTKTTYVGTALEVFFDVGGTEAQARLDADIGLKSGDDIRLYASRSEVMVLPLGGVQDLRKVPGHPMASAEMPTKASSSA